MTTVKPEEIVSGYKYGWHDPEFKPVNVVRKGLDKDIVASISAMKNEPSGCASSACARWKSSSPSRCRSGASGAATSKATRWISTTSTTTSSRWKARARPGKTSRAEIKRTFDRLGIPEAERKFLAGVGAQYDSEVVYHKHPRGPGEAGRAVPGYGQRPARARGRLCESTSARSCRRRTTSSRP